VPTLIWCYVYDEAVVSQWHGHLCATLSLTLCINGEVASTKGTLLSLYFHVMATVPNPSYLLSFRPLCCVAVLIVLLMHSDNVDSLGIEVHDDDDEEWRSLSSPPVGGRVSQLWALCCFNSSDWDQKSLIMDETTETHIARGKGMDREP